MIMKLPSKKNAQYAEDTFIVMIHNPKTTTVQTVGREWAVTHNANYINIPSVAITRLSNRFNMRLCRLVVWLMLSAKQGQATRTA